MILIYAVGNITLSCRQKRAQKAFKTKVSAKKEPILEIEIESIVEESETLRNDKMELTVVQESLSEDDKSELVATIVLGDTLEALKSILEDHFESGIPESLEELPQRRRNSSFLNVGLDKMP